MSFQTELNKYDYRKVVYSIIDNKTNENIHEHLSSLNEDQVEDDDELTLFITTTHNHQELVEYLCLIVWNWGWDGCDWFIHHPNQLTYN
jgi:hypothetical protein